MTVLDEQDIREIHDGRYSFSDLKQDHASLRSLTTSKKQGMGLPRPESYYSGSLIVFYQLLIG